MEDKSCWTCHYGKLGGINLLGKCSKFDKLITAKQSTTGKYIVDIGCKDWKKKGIDTVMNN